MTCNTKKTFERDSLVFTTKLPLTREQNELDWWLLASHGGIFTFLSGIVMVFLPSLHPRSEAVFLLAVFTGFPVVWLITYLKIRQYAKDKTTKIMRLFS